MTELKSDTSVNNFDVQMPTTQGQTQSDQKSFINHIDTTPPASRVSMATLIALVAVGLVLGELLITWVLIATQKSKLATQNNIIETNQKEITTGSLSAVNKQVTQFSDGLKVYTNYRATNKVVNPLWDDVKKYTVPNTRIKTLSLGDKGEIKIDGEAKSFVDIAEIIASYRRSEKIRNIYLISSSSGEKLKDFSLGATYSPSQPRSVNGQE